MSVAAPIAPQESPSRSVAPLRLSELIGALSYALDLTEGQPAGHCVRACWIGMHVGRTLGWEPAALHELYYTVLLKDAGCSSNAARLYELYGQHDDVFKSQWKLVDSDHLASVARFVVQNTGAQDSWAQRLHKLAFVLRHGDEVAREVMEVRCERGADIAIQLGFGPGVADGIRHLDEHWNGNGRPYGRAGDAIPANAQVALLSQVADVFHRAKGREAALEEIEGRRGTWFGPHLVDAFLELGEDDDFWATLDSGDIDIAVRDAEPAGFEVELGEDWLDRIADAFALVIDAKSGFTADHSRRVAEVTEAVASELGFDGERLRWLRRAALLHDIGKLGVSNAILDKPDRLTEEEWVHVKRHAQYSEEILARIGPFQELARVAGAHHERPDGRGYPRGLTGDQIGRETRIITVADIFDAITAARPYRGPIPASRALSMMEDECPGAVDRECLDALIRVVRA